MSIHVYAGKPGAGKSFHGVKAAQEAVKTGRMVITNLPLKLDHPLWKDALSKGLLVHYPPTTLDMGATGEHLGSLDGWSAVMEDNGRSLLRKVVVKAGKKGEPPETSELGPMIIVDESASTFESMIEDSKIRTTSKSPEDLIERKEAWRKLLEFYRHHRHSKSDIVFIAQAYAQLPADLRDLVERWHELVNLSEMWGGVKRYKIRTYLKGTQMGSTRTFDARPGAYEKEIYELYDSFALGAAEGSGDIKGVKGMLKTRPWFLRPPVLIMVAAIIACCIALYFMVGQVSGLLSPDDEPQTFGNSSTPPIAPMPDGAGGNGGGARSVQSSAGSITRAAIPPVGTTFLGSDGTALYWEGGYRYRVFDLAGVNMELSELTACRAVLIERAPDKTNRLTYVCSKGF